MALKSVKGTRVIILVVVKVSEGESSTAQPNFVTVTARRRVWWLCGPDESGLAGAV
jgi:hypothetical protein